MMKIYTNDSHTSKEIENSPKQSVLDNILNFSKAFEVHKISKELKEVKKNVEIILN